MHPKSLIIGIVIGAALMAAAIFLFGDQILGRVGDTTVEVGRTVKEAGKAIEDQADKLR